MPTTRSFAGSTARTAAPPACPGCRAALELATNDAARKPAGPRVESGRYVNPDADDVLPAGRPVPAVNGKAPKPEPGGRRGLPGADRGDTGHAVATGRRAWPQLDPAAMNGLPGDIVREIEPTTEADPVALLVQAMVAFGSMIGRTAFTLAEDDRHNCNEFAVLVGTTAKGRKGMSWGRVKRLIEAVDPDWLDNRVAGGLSSGEGLIQAVGGTDPAADKRLLIHEGEFASVLRQIERQGNTLSAILRQAWDGGRLRTLTRNNPLDAKDAHVSLIGHGTEAELTRLLSNTEAANGFANRILWVCVRRSKLLPDGGHLDPAALKPLQWRLVSAVNFAKDVELVRRTPAARALWHKVYPALSEGRPGLAGSLTARAEAHVVRLATIYALMDEKCLIDVPHLQAALALWRYCEDSVRYIWGDSLGDPVADDILTALRSAPAGMKRDELRNLFSRHKRSDEIGRALAVLADCKLARFVAVRDTGGRPAEVWFAS